MTAAARGDREAVIQRTKEAPLDRRWSRVAAARPGAGHRHPLHDRDRPDRRRRRALAARLDEPLRRGAAALLLTPANPAPAVGGGRPRGRGTARYSPEELQSGGW